MSADDVRRAVTRIAHEIVEHNHGVDKLVVVGLQTGGVPLAHRLVESLAQVDPENPASVWVAESADLRLRMS